MSDSVKFTAALKSLTSTAKDTDAGLAIETKILLSGDGIGEECAKLLLELQKAGPLVVSMTPHQRKLQA